MQQAVQFIVRALFSCLCSSFVRYGNGREPLYFTAVVKFEL